MCEKLLLLCREHRDVEMNLWPFSEILAKAVGCVRLRYLRWISGLEGTLLRLALLAIPVRRQQRVLLDPTSPTFGSLEQRGSVILVKHCDDDGEGETVVVDLPFILARMLLEQSKVLVNQGYDPKLKGMLRQLFRFESWSEKLTSIISHHDFEVFTATYEAARTWMLHDHLTSNLLPPLCTLERFFGEAAVFASNVDP
ncbi:hypothetical protein HK102_009616 [Quaeritorhiza haematococci]|nr:hypothetical protein HK102_009616 [Quaeritorhiza haematococci]